MVFELLIFIQKKLIMSQGLPSPQGPVLAGDGCGARAPDAGTVSSFLGPQISTPLRCPVVTAGGGGWIIQMLSQKARWSSGVGPLGIKPRL